MAFDQDKANGICELIAEGKSLRKAAKEYGVVATTVTNWTNDNAEFAGQYARARIAGYQARADALLDTACDETIEPASRRIIVDTMKWELSKMLPKVYGDKLDMAVSGDLTVTVRKMTLPDATPSVQLPESAPKDGV